MTGTFALDLTRLCKKAEIDMRTVVRKIAFEAFRKVVVKTPVDRGTARANWNVSVGKADTTTDLNATDKSGQTTIAKITSATQSWTGQGSIFLCNSLDYISTLEYGRYPNPPKFGTRIKGQRFGEFRSANGYSYQAPQGMVRITVEEIQNWANSQGAINGND